MSETIQQLQADIANGNAENAILQQQIAAHNLNGASDATLVSRQGSSQQVQQALNQPVTTSGASTNNNSTLSQSPSQTALNSAGTLVASTTTPSKDMRLVIAPAGASAVSAVPQTPATSVFNSAQLAQHQGNSSGTTAPTTTTTGTPMGTGYYTGILAPLMQTNGVLFPYSPVINFTQAVDYSLVGGGLVHTNQDYNAYQRTPSVSLTIQGQFTIQNQYEGQYMLAVIHFFRTVSKMYFGQAAAASGQAGLPPPILILNGYGTYMFNNLPCILTTHSFDYDGQVDTVDVSDPSGGLTKLPSILTLSLGLTVQQTPYNMSTKFDLNAFRSGALMQTGGGWI